MLNGAGVVVQELKGEQRRVAFVHVVLANFKPQCPEHAHPAHAEHHFLLEPVGLVAAVQVVGQGLVVGVIFWQTGVKQDDGLVAVQASGQGV